MMSPVPNDSIHVVVEGLHELSSTTPAEWTMNAITLLIALGGLITSIVVAIKSRSDNQSQTSSARKLELMKTLILDHQMSSFYEHFKKLQAVLGQLKAQGCDKSAIEKNMQPIFRRLNEEILVLFRAVDESLHEKLLNQSDKCRDKLVESIGDDGINLYIDSKYNEHILQPLTEAQQEIIRIIYNYVPTDSSHS
ncbi:MAG: hypothetical protein NC453_28850 [Muribaculum sp.]|nr:hypothetical protein [Muribaculum sp.]